MKFKLLPLTLLLSSLFITTVSLAQDSTDLEKTPFRKVKKMVKDFKKDIKEKKAEQTSTEAMKKAIKKFKGYKTNFNVGLGLGTQTDLYKGGNVGFPVIPVFGFKYKNFYGYGINLGYTFYWNWPTLSVSLRPELLSLRAEKGTITEGLSDRKISLNAGITAIFPTKWAVGTIDMYHDVLGRYDGYQFNFEINKHFKLTKGISLIAGIGGDWVSSDYTGYYFGVSQAESNPAIGRPYFEGHATVKARGRLILVYELGKKTSLVLINQFTHLPNDISNSPLVRKNYLNRFYATITYSF